jgi:hypothetical protein
VHALSLWPEEAQEFHRLGSVIGEPVWDPGVELGGLTRSEDQIVLAQDQAEPALQDVQPFVALMGLRVRYLWGLPGRDGVLVRLQAAGSPGERLDGHPVASDRAGTDAGVAGVRSPDEVVKGYLVGLGQGQEELEVRSALA